MTDSLDRTRPVDCTVDAGIPADAEPNMDGLAKRVFGKPIGELTAHDQRLVRVALKGHRMELQEELKSLKQNNALDAHTRLKKLEDARDKTVQLINLMAGEIVDLATEDDVEVAYHKDYKKTKSGHARRTMRHIKEFVTIQKIYADTEIAIAKLGEDKGTVFVKEGDKTVNIGPVKPEDFRAELESAIKGELVDQSGDGDVRGDS